MVFVVPNRHLHLAGGIKNHAHIQSCYEKWVLSRPYATECVNGLLDIADLASGEDVRTCLRPSQKAQSERRVQRVVSVIEDDFINPFASDIDPEQLFNIVSGRPLPAIFSESLLSCYDRGVDRLDVFNQRLELSDSEQVTVTASLMDPIPRSKWFSFMDAQKKIVLHREGKATKEIRVQRDILAKLTAVSTERKQPVDIDKALNFSLAPVPLSLATADGERRHTQKSKLLDEILPKTNVTINDINQYDIYILDVIAYFRSLKCIKGTFEDLALRMLNSIPKKYQIVYMACDAYGKQSIKYNEHLSRGIDPPFIIKNANIKIPSDFQKFLNNGENKDRLLEIVETVLIKHKNNLGKRVVYFARGAHCYRIDCEDAELVEELVTDHIEADTKIVYLAIHAHRMNSVDRHPTRIVVRSPSGDTDIVVLLLQITTAPSLNISIDNGVGKNRKYILLSECSLQPQQKRSLIGVHAYTGNDFVSCFFRKGKKKCWREALKNPQFVENFEKLGEDVFGEEQLFELEKYVSKIYGRKEESINDARRALYWKCMKREVVPDLSLLPPCRQSLSLHSKRANFVSLMWRRAVSPIMNLPLPSVMGWLEDFSFDWVGIPFPDDIADLLLPVTEDDDDDYDESNDGEELSDCSFLFEEPEETNPL